MSVDARVARTGIAPTRDDMDLAGELLAGAVLADGESVRRLIAVGITLGRSLATGTPPPMDPYWRYPEGTR